MQLPEELQEAIALEADKYKLGEILTARENLTGRYRGSGPQKSAFIGSEAERCAYIVARLPATYGVICRVFQELKQRANGAAIHSLLDLGAGPGTAMWAAGHIFPEITQYSLIEQDAALMELGKRLAGQAQNSYLPKAQWHLQKMEDLKEITQHDLVILSYSVGELKLSAVQPLIEACWHLAKQYLVIIEPGTRKGFDLIRAVRSQLIEMGGHPVAPCPHAAACPMPEGDWCHFSERIERSFLHRRIKKGTLGYEDEKFSYIVCSKGPCVLPDARVLRHPQKHTGHVALELCTAEGLKKQVVSKRTPAEYKRARKLEWGSTIEKRESDAR